MPLKPASAQPIKGCDRHSLSASSGRPQFYCVLLCVVVCCCVLTSLPLPSILLPTQATLAKHTYILTMQFSKIFVSLAALSAVNAASNSSSNETTSVSTAGAAGAATYGSVALGAAAAALVALF